ncbi:hypothetical protein [Ammoniphilus sp. 3BR4]
MENLSDNQKAYAKNYLANQAESVEEALTASSANRLMICHSNKLKDSRI